MHAHNHYHDLKNYVSSIGKHGHICMMYCDREQQITALVEYFKSGLRLGQQCVYIADEAIIGFVRNVMSRAGMDVDADISDGSLTFLTPEQTYLSGGNFNGKVMAEMIEQLIGSAYAAGFNGLRGAGDMSWVFAADVSGKELLRYEADINRIFEQYPFFGLCQYDSNKFNREVLKFLIKTHPTVLKGGEVLKNPTYIPPAEFIKLLDEQPVLKVAV